MVVQNKAIHSKVYHHYQSSGRQFQATGLAATRLDKISHRRYIGSAGVACPVEQFEHGAGTGPEPRKDLVRGCRYQTGGGPMLLAPCFSRLRTLLDHPSFPTASLVS